MSNNNNTRDFGSFTLVPHVKEGNAKARTYCLTAGRFRYFITPELLAEIVAQGENIANFLQETRESMMSREESKFERQAQGVEKKILAQQAELVIKQKALKFMRDNKGMDWNSALELAKADTDTETVIAAHTAAEKLRA